MSDVDYLTYLERQFEVAEHEEEPLRSGFEAAYKARRTFIENRQELGESAEFSDVSLMIAPTSRVGPIFGLTQRDIDRSVTRLNEQRALTYPQELRKRGLDILLAAIALVPILILMPVIALAMKLDSPGPVFFRQTRMGRAGRPFAMLKFRTMHMDAEGHLRALATVADGTSARGVLFKMRADPRITRVGSVLRRFSLDELPQFINVLSGSMSIVGPRPPLPSEMQSERPLRMQPGITGLWALRGRSGALSWEEARKSETAYAANWTLRRDLGIMARTAGALVDPMGFE